MPETLRRRRPAPRKDVASEERERLLALLLRDGILRAAPRRPVVSRDGKPARWMLNSLDVSLSGEGLALAGRQLLGLLERFEGRQLATLGTTAIPLLSSCILQSNGRCHGLLVRKERKAHGSRKWIEGRIDRDQPVVMIDDSVSSGTTMEECRARLEQAGLWVEGGISLVRFGWYGGFALMQEQGLAMASVYDIWEDFIYRMEDEPEAPPENPTKIFPAETWRTDPAPEGLHPAALARLVIAGYLENGTLPRPPERLDRSYDGAGGTWISVRPRADVYQRHARDGFWHFPGESRGSLPRDVTLAALKTASQLPAGEGGLALLDGSAIAVTLFSALEPVTVGELDNDRYGIVVASRERRGRMGGALPRMPGISTSWQQFEHARRKNAQLISFEPYDLYRHEVYKLVEPDADWQPSGVPRQGGLWHQDPERIGRVAARARRLVLEELGLAGGARTDGDGGEILDDDLLPPVESLFVTVYLAGHLRGCMGSAVERLDHDLRRLAGLALEDSRFMSQGVTAAEEVAVTVSLLWGALELDVFSPEEVMDRVRLGEQALLAHQGERSGLLLPFVAAQRSLAPVAYAQEVIDKAGIAQPPYRWRRFECTTWLADAHAPPRALAGALPVPAAPSSSAPAETHEHRLERLGGLFASYLLRQRRDDGTLYYRYQPHQDVLYEELDLPRAAHGAWVLARAGRRRGDPELADAGRRLIGFLRARLVRDDAGRPWLENEHEPSSIAELAFLLLALCETAAGAHDDDGGGNDKTGLGSDGDRALARELADALWARVGRHGRIATHRPPGDDYEAYQDYFPGQALLALARACETGLAEVDEGKLRWAFRHYRHRFRNRRHFGQVPWQTQAFAAWWRVGRDPEHARWVFEIADWIAGYQEAGGGFLGDHQPDGPGFTTALYLEGVGAAARLARAAGDGERAARYRGVCERGLRFVDSLVIHEDMGSVLPNPAWAIGGLRQSHRTDEVRIDFVQHGLGMVLELSAEGEGDG